MENGEPKLEGLAASLAKARAERDRQEAQGLRVNSKEAEVDNKAREIQFKSSHGLIVAFFTLIALLHVLGTYLFTSGFLLTRLVLEHKSDCAVSPIDLEGAYKPGNHDVGCWHPKSFKKAVVIIVDALRYDFTVPHVPDGPDDKPHHYHNALPFFYETATQEPDHAFLLPFIADPPTTTLQRLKGLTTGTLPTFIDAGSNFAGTAIDEDNLVDQLRVAGRNIVHLGDDTWHALFPGYFDPELTRPYDSFNVWDLHTLDNGVTEHLFPLMAPANQSRWDVIFGHYLGVDHAGHRYGPDHPAMTAKLNQMDETFRRLKDSIDDETLLVVMGDHGMDGKGDHGGESFDEVQAALWMYSKRPLFGRTSQETRLPPATAKDRPVAQIDLVPTLALLLGLPIPFNNLGAPMEEAFIGSKGQDYKNFAAVYRLASAQIHRYQHEYSLVRGFLEEDRASSLALWNKAAETWTSVRNIKRPSQKDWEQALDVYMSYQRETVGLCRALWARFDVPRMFQGIGVLAVSLVALVVYARGLEGDPTELTPILLTRGGVGTLAGALFGAVPQLITASYPKLQNIALGSGIGGLIGMVTAFWYIRKRLTLPIANSLWSWICVTFTVALSIGFASNSFTIWEDEILLFYLATFGLLMFFSSLRQSDAKSRTLGCTHSIAFMALTRLASLSRLCREEQMPCCRSTYYASASSSTSAIWQLAIPFILAIALPNVISIYYKQTRSYHHSAILWIGFALRIGLLLSALYWTLDAADDGDWFGPSSSLPWLKTVKIMIAQITLGIAFAGGYPTYTWTAPLLSVESVSKADLDKESKDSKAEKHILHEGGSSSIVILGYSNVHGSRYFLLLTLWLLAIILTQKPMGAGAIGVLTWQILSLLELIDVNNLSSSPIGPIILGLLGSFHFFKTGHQAVLSSIQWETAFIPLKTIRYPWSPFLILLNTLGPQILCIIAVPATVLWKRQPRQKGLLGEVARAIATHVLFYATIQLATTMWAGHLRRHLMLYRIFSPRWMTGSIMLLGIEVAGILIAVWGCRYSFASVAEVFGWT